MTDSRRNAGHPIKKKAVASVEKINLEQKYSLFHEFWSPKIVGELNDSYIKLAKLKGEFDWHHHDQEDELFSSSRAN